MKHKIILIWLLRAIAAVIMLQTLYFKFSGHPQSIHLFSSLGMEPWGRYGTGILELVASILILVPRISFLGSLLGLGLMSGAIYYHLTTLGIYFDGDPVLFVYAVIVFICCTVLLFIQRTQFLQMLNRLLHSTFE